jgi:hypothetical protein
MSGNPSPHRGLYDECGSGSTVGKTLYFFQRQAIHYFMFITNGQCCRSRMFYPKFRIRPFTQPRSQIRIKTFFHNESWIIHEKWNANLLYSCFLCFQEQNFSLSHSQKDLRSGIQDLGSDPG